MSVQVRGSMQHVCRGCGGSCRGVVVRVTDEEAARVRDLAPELGVDEPVVDGALRRSEGACVFLGPDARCRLHAAHGAESKPAICRQYPLVAVQTESGMRVGIDPGCYTHIATWRTAPMITGGDLQGSRLEYPSALAEAEGRVLALLEEPGQDLAGALAGLLGVSGTPPVDFLDRLQAWRGRIPWSELLADTSFGASFTEALELLRTPADAAWPALGHDDEAYALDAVRRAVFLRVLHRLGGPEGAAMLMLCGIVLLAQATDDGEALGRGIAAWSRGLRSPRFVGALIPDQGTLRWLVTGQPP